MNDCGQWIVTMAILVSVGLFFLAFILNQATIVGQTTSEGVLEFSKNDIQDLRSEILEWGHWVRNNPTMSYDAGRQDIISLAQYRKNAIISFDINQIAIRVSGSCYYPITVHFNNGVTEYNERITYYIGEC